MPFPGNLQAGPVSCTLHTSTAVCDGKEGQVVNLMRPRLVFLDKDSVPHYKGDTRQIESSLLGCFMWMLFYYTDNKFSAHNLSPLILVQQACSPLFF